MAKRVTTIPATLNRFDSRPIAAAKKRKTAGYARVSTDSEEQATSYEAQVDYYTRYMLCKKYSLNPLTDGVIISHREGYNRGIASNHGDPEHLWTQLGMGCTISDEGELLLTLLASFAQEESRSISENVKWGIRKRFEQGIPNGHKAPYGYEWDGEMYRIIPEQGEIIKEIFAKYLSGASAYGIAKELSERGVTGQKGVPMDDSTIKFILANPSYTGSMLLQKNFISEGHTRKRNKGELPMYMVEGMFEPLITQADFEKAQAIREERAENAANKNPVLTAFSGLVRCGECGCSASRRTTKYGKKWNCNTRERKGKDMCGLRPVYESELEQASAAALGLDAFDGDAVKREVGRIVINADSIEFGMKNGRVRKIMRAYQKGRSAFSQKITCGCCGRKLECDYWKIGPKGQKERRRVWVCRGCTSRRLMDDEFREAVAAVLGSEDYEPRFVKEVADVTVFEDRFEFHFTDGEVAEWQRE